MTSKVVRALLFSASVLALGSAGWAQPARSAGSCSDATLTGTYGILFTGADSGGNAVATVGQVTSNGKGKLVGVWTQNVEGVVANNVPLTGAYKVDAKCTGSVTITPNGGTMAHFDIVVDTSGHRFEVIVTDSGQTELGYALAQGNANCSKAGLTGAWGEQASGILLGIGLGATIGQLNLNGNGKVSGTATESAAGNIDRVKVVGTYKINSNCRGMFTITPTNQGTDHSSFVVVNGGQELLLVGTDSALVVAGTTQR